MPKQHLFLLRALRWATVAVFLAASLELLRQIVFLAPSAWPAHAAAILVCASIVSVLNLGSLCRTKAQPEKFQENIIENLPEIACIIGDGGQFKQWNSNLETVLGYTSEEITKMTAFDTIAEGQRETVQEAITTTLTRGLAKVESVLVARDGTRIPCLLTGVRVVLNDEPCTLGIAVDLRKLRQAEESLLELASIVLFSEDAIIGNTRDGVITSWNRAAEKMYGYTRDEVVGRDLSFLLPPEKQTEIPALMERILSGKPIESLETERLTKAGVVLDVSLSISPIKDAAGRITGASTIARDITLRKRSEEQLKLQSAALEAANNAIVITDYEGKIMWVNRAFTAMTGYSEEEVLGKNTRVLK